MGRISALIDEFVNWNCCIMILDQDFLYKTAAAAHIHTNCCWYRADDIYTMSQRSTQNTTSQHPWPSTSAQIPHRYPSCVRHQQTVRLGCLTSNQLIHIHVISFSMRLTLRKRAPVSEFKWPSYHFKSGIKYICIQLTQSHSSLHKHTQTTLTVDKGKSWNQMFAVLLSLYKQDQSNLPLSVLTSTSPPFSVIPLILLFLFWEDSSSVRVIFHYYEVGGESVFAWSELTLFVCLKTE